MPFGPTDRPPWFKALLAERQQSTRNRIAELLAEQAAAPPPPNPFAARSALPFRTKEHIKQNFAELRGQLGGVKKNTVIKWAQAYIDILALPFDPTPHTLAPVSGEIPWR